MRHLPIQKTKAGAFSKPGSVAARRVKQRATPDVAVLILVEPHGTRHEPKFTEHGHQPSERRERVEKRLEKFASTAPLTKIRSNPPSPAGGLVNSPSTIFTGSGSSARQAFAFVTKSNSDSSATTDSAKPAQDGRRIARRAADIENAVLRTDLARLEHAGKNQRRQKPARRTAGRRQVERHVRIGERRETFRQKFFARHFEHPRDDRLIVHIECADLTLDHRAA